MKNILIISLALFIGINAFATETKKKETILFVCGGNTGRSVMSEYYTNSKYNNVDAFSRGSGIDPLDSPKVEKYAKQLIVESHEASNKEVNSHRATQISITDIYNANIVLTMGTKYNNRLDNMIDRECSDFNLNYPNRSFNKDQWVKMCNNKQALKNKIHSIVGCATGVDGDIPDAYGQDKDFYIKTRDNLIKNINKIVPYFIKNNTCPATKTL